MTDAIRDTPISTLKVRPAELADLDLCLTLDPAYSTEFVWQMDLTSEDGQVAVAFRTVRLPRSMRVEYPHDREQLIAGWKRCDGFLVAERAGQLVGYMALRAATAEGLAWASDLVVQRTQRRQGVGLALLNEAGQWARARHLRWLVLEAQTKNHPAICFCQKNGFSFCGFNDHYYPSQDIAVFFARSVR
jgi:GNAT superfamily N-acetyltransferase